MEMTQSAKENNLLQVKNPLNNTKIRVIYKK